jgi:hypothetical protein
VRLIRYSVALIGSLTFQHRLPSFPSRWTRHPSSPIAIFAAISSLLSPPRSHLRQARDDDDSDVDSDAEMEDEPATPAKGKGGNKKRKNEEASPAGKKAKVEGEGEETEERKGGLSIGAIIGKKRRQKGKK